MERVYAGVDLGTSAMKLLLMEEKGSILRIVSRSYPVAYPQNGWSEQEPEDWRHAAMDGLKELLAGYESALAGISFGGQMHGLVCLDGEDKVLRPAILWNDGRTEEECRYLNEEIGEEVLAKETGNIAFAGFTAPKILWMKKHEPELFEKIAKIMLPKDYLAYMLSGVHATDPSDASGMLLYDVEHRCWSRKMCEICHIRPEQLAKVYESYEVIGNLKTDIAEELGVSPKVQVIIGGGDNAAAAVGTGTLQNGDCTISLGTSGTVFVASDDYLAMENHALHSFAHANGKYHIMGCMLSAAACNGWWLSGILKETDFAAAQAQITKLGQGHVYFLPYLSGERSPHNDPTARGAFMGLSMDTERADMLQAVYEGVAFGLRDSVEAARRSGIRIEKARLCGGGAKSPLWRRIIAAVTKVDVQLIESEEGPALGAAMLAAVGCGAYRNTEEAAGAVVRYGELIPAERNLAERYDEQYEKWKKLYPALKGLV